MSTCRACSGESRLPGHNTGHAALCPFKSRRFFNYPLELKMYLFRGVATGQDVAACYEDWLDIQAAKQAAAGEKGKMKRELEIAQEKGQKAMRVVERARKAETAAAEARVTGEPAPSTPKAGVSDETIKKMGKSVERTLSVFGAECPLCGTGKLRTLQGINGPFIACSNFFSKDIKCPHTRSVPEAVQWPLLEAFFRHTTCFY